VAILTATLKHRRGAMDRLGIDAALISSLRVPNPA
jgi:hypothetical protein